MATSFTRTRKQLADMVLRKLGVLAAGGAEVSADLEVCFEAIDLRLKEMHRQGIFWRKVEEVPLSFTVAASTISASATADILFPIRMTVADGSMDEPVSIIGIKEYAQIEDKNQAGFPTKALWKGGAEFLFHPIPTAASTGKLVYEKLADDTSHGAAPDVEVSMLRWLKDIVAYDIGDDFEQPEGKMQRFLRESLVAEKNIRMLNAERKSFSRIAVDEWDDYLDRRESDYDR